MEDYGTNTQVLNVENLAISYQIRKGEVPAVRNVSFEINRGETFGLVGESGCGKSTVAFGIVNFLGRNGRIVEGSILFQGRELRGRREEELRRLRGNQISMVYQDPMAALNPSLRIGEQLAEVLIVHRSLSKDDAHRQCIEMLNRVYMPDPKSVMIRYPHQLSGGQQQRVVIAMALLNSPALLIMDEPTTALDVTVEAAVLDLIDELRREFDTAIMYITHNLGVIARVSDQVGVMYAGEIVERGPVEDIFLKPMHPYTQGLMRCVPKLGLSKESSYLYPIRGRVPSPMNLPLGCVFEPRCDFAREECRHQRPELQKMNHTHFARCHHAEENIGAEWEPPEDLASALTTARPFAEEPILRVEHLRKYFEQEQRSLVSLVGLGEKQYVKAVDDVSLEIPKGCTVGLVGESGCGKSTLARVIVGLEPVTDGKIDFLGVDISIPLDDRDMDIVKELQMVFQNPDSTLNPSFSVGHQIARPLVRFKTVRRNQVREEVIRLLNAVKLDQSYYDRLPRQLSGGEKQRIGIARAFAAQPDVVLCDEPVSALDVSVQAAVLNLLLEIQHEFGTTMLFIAHDLSVVRFFSDYVAVMYLGKLCEVGTAEAIYAPPYHPYTEALLSAVPIPDPRAKQKRIRLSGTVPSALNPPTGCRFHPRCPRKKGEICETEEPPPQLDRDGHHIYCHTPLEELRKVEPVVTIVE
ncbi:MAG: glutathione ABC transporter ATP-binding protein [Chloroflexi bacterium B3_Chlor]|nr:MAG: glutathione ABC transporter ATP-binding protein [Chloroflexi bacterium B3_Chlor]